MRFSHLVIAASLISFPILVTANQPLCDADSVHCTTFEMTQSQHGQQTAQLKGRYIKAIGTLGDNQAETFTDCFSAGSTIEFPADAVQSGYVHVGDVFKAEYRQCKDKHCATTIPIGSEEFTVEKRPGMGYTSTPASYVVHLDPSYGEACDVSFRKSSMTRARVK